MMVAMHASRSRPTVSSRRCCWVLAISGSDFLGTSAALPLARPQIAAGLPGLAVALSEPALSEDDNPAHTRCDDGMVIAIDHAAQATVERHGLLVVAVDGFVETGGVDHDEVRPVALAQRAGVDAEPLPQLAGQAVDRALRGQARGAGPVRVPRALEPPQTEGAEGAVAQGAARN